MCKGLLALGFCGKESPPWNFDSAGAISKSLRWRCHP